jgi:hypothetical protein
MVLACNALIRALLRLPRGHGDKQTSKLDNNVLNADYMLFGAKSSSSRWSDFAAKSKLD